MEGQKTETGTEKLLLLQRADNKNHRIDYALNLTASVMTIIS